MKNAKLGLVVLAFAVSACAQNPAPVPVSVAAAPAPAAIAPPTPLVTAPTPPAVDPALLVAAQRNLRALGYNAGKAGDIADPALQKAITAFQKDQGLAEDGRLTTLLADRIDAVYAALPKAAAAENNRTALYVYSDGAVRRQPFSLLLAPPDGLVSDAPANFLQPLRAGSHAAYHLGHRAQDGNFATVTTVTCRAARVTRATVPLSASDAIVVDCHGDGGQPLQWRATYSAKARAVLRFEDSSGMHDLVAIRPITADWPSAARTGLDWAITHALDTNVITPVQWSSTGVAPHFQISATSATLSGHDAGLGGRYAALPCRRFDMVQSGTPAIHYPGIACQDGSGLWSLPGSAAAFASPANAIASRAPAPGPKNHRN